MGVLGSREGAAQGWDSLNREQPDPYAQEEKNSVGYEEGGWTVDLIYGSQRGKSLGILAPGGLGKAEAEGKPVGWTLETLEVDEEVLGPGKEQSWGTNLSTLQQEDLAV